MGFLSKCDSFEGRSGAGKHSLALHISLTNKEFAFLHVIFLGGGINTCRPILPEARASLALQGINLNCLYNGPHCCKIGMLFITFPLENNVLNEGKGE